MRSGCRLKIFLYVRRQNMKGTADIQNVNVLQAVHICESKNGIYARCPMSKVNTVKNGYDTLNVYIRCYKNSHDKI